MAKSQYSEMEAAEELGVTVEQLRGMIRSHVVDRDEDLNNVPVTTFQPADLLILRLLAGMPPNPDRARWELAASEEERPKLLTLQKNSRGGNLSREAALWWQLAAGSNIKSSGCWFCLWAAVSLYSAAPASTAITDSATPLAVVVTVKFNGNRPDTPMSAVFGRSVPITHVITPT
jgi:hypothetical protein